MACRQPVTKAQFTEHSTFSLKVIGLSPQVGSYVPCGKLCSPFQVKKLLVKCKELVSTSHNIQKHAWNNWLTFYTCNTTETVSNTTQMYILKKMLLSEVFRTKLLFISQLTINRYCFLSRNCICTVIVEPLVVNSFLRLLHVQLIILSSNNEQKTLQVKWGLVLNIQLAHWAHSAKTSYLLTDFKIMPPLMNTYKSCLQHVKSYW